MELKFKSQGRDMVLKGIHGDSPQIVSYSQKDGEDLEKLYGQPVAL